jgi:mannose-6-phosphate isomerase-like protein (cupin superfamily)
MARPIKVNVPRYLIDLNNEEHWLYTASPPITRADGKPNEEMAVFIRPDDSGHKLYAMTDSIMMSSVRDDYVPRFHEHRTGYETWFVDSNAMDISINGQVTRIEPGTFFHLQPYMIHCMYMYGDVKFRGFFQDWNGADTVPYTQLMEHYQPGLKAKFKKADVYTVGHDHFEHETMDCVRVPNEEVYAVRHPDRPIAKFASDGVTIKLMVGRWECGGIREINYFEFEKGFKAETVDFPAYRELYFIREGEIKFKIFSDEFVAYKDCLVDIPSFIPHSIEALTKSAMYDMGGRTCWYDFLINYTTMLKKSPEKAKDAEVIEKLRRLNGFQIKSFGMGEGFICIG